MAVQMMNSASEVAGYIADQAANEAAEAMRSSSEANRTKVEEPKVEAKAKEPDDAPEWVKRGNISPEQHKIVTEVIQRAINKKHGQAKEAEEFAAEQYNEKRLAEQKLDAIERENAELKAKLVPAKSAEDITEPKRENYGDDEKYLDARSEWIAERKFLEREQKEAQRRSEEERQQVMMKATERVNTAKELVEDWEDVVGGNEAMVPAVVATYMQGSELIAEYAYHFAKHPDVLVKLAKMKPERALVEIGKIESTLQSFAELYGKTSSKASRDSTSRNGKEPSQTTGTNPSPPRATAPVFEPISVGSGNQVERPANKMNYSQAKSDWEKRNGRSLSVRSRH